jgi:hypothetical protein
MKKLIAYVGLATVGAGTMHAQFNPGLTPEEMAKAWSVAATVRGFYDDNYLTLPNLQTDGTRKRSSYGAELSPQASWNYAPEQTSLNVNYVYDIRYFDDRETTEQTHIFNANLSHTFSERYNMQAGETFIYSKEPTINNGILAVFTTGDYIHNTATIGGTAELSKLLDAKIAYQNDVYAYQQLAGDVAPGTASRSGLLDRMEQLASLDLDWKATEQLTGILGYQYGHVGYTSPEAIIFTPFKVYSQSRNNDSDFVYLGADEQFTSTLTGRVRAGAQYIEYDNAPTHANATDPYVDASITWEYMKDASAQIGAKHQHNATDFVGTDATAKGNPVLDTEATAGYVNVTQKIAGALTASALGQFQHSTFNGGSVNGQTEDFMILGVNLGYAFSPYLSAEAGYNWNKLVSDAPNAGTSRDYTRNQVYLGVKGEF